MVRRSGPPRTRHDGMRSLRSYASRPSRPTGSWSGILVLLFIWNPIPATGKPLGILVFTVLALFGTYILIQQTARRIPRGTFGGRDARDAHARGEHARAPTPVRRLIRSAAGPTTADQLKQLADLRDRGAISPEEYQSAKAKLLDA